MRLRMVRNMIYLERLFKSSFADTILKFPSLSPITMSSLLAAFSSISLRTAFLTPRKTLSDSSEILVTLSSAIFGLFENYLPNIAIYYRIIPAYCTVGDKFRIVAQVVNNHPVVANRDMPEILNCKEFVNADSIAAGLSPFNPESVAMEAGRIMLQRIDQLMKEGVNFAFETTLAAKSYVTLIRAAREIGYEITLLYFWLSSPDLAKERVAKRVSMGGHNIPPDTIERR